MGDEPKKVLTKIRTFAQDLEQQKGKGVPVKTKEDVSASSTPPPEPVVIADKLKAPEVFKNPNPSNTTPPAFHELHKKNPQHTETEVVHVPASFTRTPAAPEAKLAETVTVPKNPKKKSTSYTEATIITDTKKNKVNIVTSSASSLSLWWKEFLKGFKRKQPPKYTVADVERRKGVIQKATSKTATIFTADNETLKEEIRRRQLHATQGGAPTGEHAALLWSPNTEPGYPLLPTAPADNKPVQNVTVTFKKRSVPPPVIVEPSVPRPITPIPHPKTEAVEKESVAPTLAEKAPTPPPIEIPQPYTPPAEATTWVSPTVPTPDLQPTPFRQPTVEAPVVSEPVQTIPEKTVVSPKLTFHFGNFDRVNTNRLSLSIVGILGGAIIAVFLVRVGMGMFNPEASQTVSNEPAVALSSGSQIVDMPISSLSQTSIDAALTLVPQTSSGISEIRLLNQSTNTVIPTQEILRYFNFQTNPNFNQSVAVVHLTLINSERALLLRVTDATTVFGALLEWEPSMAADLASLLQIQTPPTNERFTDGTIGQSDIRILTINNTEAVVYGFIDKNTVLIAKNQAAFTALVNRQ
jgi:hypothetical protein